MTIERATRAVVKIDQDKCDGCGLCVPKCAEGAIQIVDGKARLVAENLCDGLGNCLGTCPRGAITIERRPAEPFDEHAVHKQQALASHAHQGCPGAAAMDLHKPSQAPSDTSGSSGSQLRHWPVKLALVPTSGAMWRGADVLIAADCAAYAMGGFHERLMTGRTVVIACPKLDDTGPYVEKLARIFAGNDIRSVTVVRMEVPCCQMERLVQAAMDRSAKQLPITIVQIGLDGQIQSVAQLRANDAKPACPAETERENA